MREALGSIPSTHTHAHTYQQQSVMGGTSQGQRKILLGQLFSVRKHLVPKGHLTLSGDTFGHYSLEECYLHLVGIGQG